MKYISPEDLNEMRRRGYDPSTIADAEKESEKVERICSQIESAFAGVSLGRGVGLLQSRALDDYADETAIGALRCKDEQEDWHRIPITDLNRASGGLSFFDPEGMRFHLPAYLIAELKGEYSQGVAFVLIDLDKHRMAKFSLLSGAQRMAVQEFLIYAAEQPEYAFKRAHIFRAIDIYWAQPPAQGS